jgi:hypothetical protein
MQYRISGEKAHMTFSHKYFLSHKNDYHIYKFQIKYVTKHSGMSLYMWAWAHVRTHAHTHTHNTIFNAASKFID